MTNADRPNNGSDDVCINNHYTEHFAPHLHDVQPASFAQPGGIQRALPPLLCECRAWAATGILLLWRQVPIDVLLCIINHARRQLYANAIRDLSFYNPFRRDILSRLTRVKGLGGLRFPRLRRVDTLTGVNQLAAGAIAPFLQPRLEVLKCDARHLSDAAVQQRLLGAAQCRQLRELHLSTFRCGADGGGGGGVAAAQKCAGANLAAAVASDAGVHNDDDDDCRSLNAIIEALPALETLIVWLSVHWCIAYLDRRLAALPRLKTLQGVAFDTQTLIGVVRDIAQPFPALRELRVDLLSSDALPVLVSVIRDIEHLELAFGRLCQQALLFRGPAS
jgi:hypothetical protein